MLVLTNQKKGDDPKVYQQSKQYNLKITHGKGIKYLCS